MKLLKILIVLMPVLVMPVTASSQNLSCLKANPAFYNKLKQQEKLAPPEVRAEILRLRGSDPVQRAYAAISLGNMGKDARYAVLALIEILYDERTLISDQEERNIKMGKELKYSTTPAQKATAALSSIGASAIEALSIAMTDSQPEVCKHAVEALSDISDPGVTGVFIKGLKDGSSFIRAECAKRLGQPGDTVALVPLLNLFRIEEDEYVIKVTAESIVIIKDKKSVPSLVEALQSSGKAAREAAALALGKLRDTTATLPLINLLSDSDPDTRIAAIQALGELHDPRSIRPLISISNDANFKIRKTAIINIGLFEGEEVTEFLINALKDPAEEIVEEAARGLAHAWDPSAIDPLVMAMKKGNNPVIIAVATTLGAKQVTTALPYLVSQLGNLNESTRSSAEEAILKINSPVSTALLIKAMANKRNDLVRIAGMLGKIKDPEAVNVLIVTLRDPVDINREAAAKALGEIGDPRAVYGLTALLNDPDFGVRNAALLSLLLIHDPGSFDLMLKSTGNQNSQISKAAYMALGESGDSRACPVLLERLRVEKYSDVQALIGDALVKINDRSVTETLINMLNSSLPSYRQGIVIALGGLGDGRAVKPLLNALESSKVYEQISIIEALGRLGDQTATGPLVALLDIYGSEARNIAICKTLGILTKNDFGNDLEKWKKWYKSLKSKN